MAKTDCVMCERLNKHQKKLWKALQKTRKDYMKLHSKYVALKDEK